jgi:hypothetical protein
MLFLKSLILAMSIEGGMIPGHTLALSAIPDNNIYSSETEINTDHAYYVDMQSDVEAMKYAHIYGGMTVFDWATKSQGMRPFRMDFTLGAKLSYSGLTIGYEHGCFHPMTPLSNQVIGYSIDYSVNRLYVKAEIKKQFFN